MQLVVFVSRAGCVLPSQRVNKREEKDVQYLGGVLSPCPCSPDERKALHLVPSSRLKRSNPLRLLLHKHASHLLFSLALELPSTSALLRCRYCTCGTSSRSCCSSTSARARASKSSVSIVVRDRRKCGNEASERIDARLQGRVGCLRDERRAVSEGVRDQRPRKTGRNEGCTGAQRKE